MRFVVGDGSLLLCLAVRRRLILALPHGECGRLQLATPRWLYSVASFEAWKVVRNKSGDLGIVAPHTTLAPPWQTLLFPAAGLSNTCSPTRQSRFDLPTRITMIALPEQPSRCRTHHTARFRLCGEDSIPIGWKHAAAFGKAFLLRYQTS